MTALDAPYYVGIGKDFYRGEFYSTSYLYDYPRHELWYRKSRPLRAEETGENQVPVKDLEKQTFPTSVPLLSFLVAILAPFFAGNFYLVGHWLVISLAGLFIIPLGIYGWRIGYPIAGLLGGLIGTFCSEYL